ncbi:MAG TPA: LysR substrate-binding domain-containing protein [Burkholderiales bacterium]|nr:LysR substrate-binding domain-containing protein [Burkholderiales bacterium]
MNLRHLSYLIALAREGHFGRAAESVHVTQPALSAAINQLEEELAVPLVTRTRQGFEGFTAEGREVLAWAQRIQADVESLKQTLGEMKGQLKGHLRLGVIPTAEPIIATLTRALHDQHPNITVTVLSMTSQEIERGLEDLSLEAGVAYLEDKRMENLRGMQLYLERYVVIGAAAMLGKGKSIAWAEAAKLPLCLLSRDMHNRALIDEHFAAAGVVPSVVAETNTLMGVLSHVRSGAWCGVLPRTVLGLLDKSGDLRCVALREPDVVHPVGLLYAPRKPLSPLIQALVEATKRASFAEAV